MGCSIWSKPGLGLRVPRVWIAVLVLCSAAPAAEKCTAPRSADLHQIERLVAAEMARYKVPGISAAIGENLRLAWSKGFGMASLENRVPARPDTVYRIGSISKPITAVAAMQLAEKGRLDLDVPIQKYVPSFPPKQWPVTARELLGHLSGIRHYKSFAEVYSTRHYADLLEPLKIFEDEPLLFEPGTHFLYSTYGYSLLGAAVEAASGMRFADYVRQNVLAPAHMDHTRVDDPHAVIPNRARGYRLAIDGNIESCALADSSNKIPGGGFISTAEDLVRFAIAVERGRLVGDATRARMFTPAHTRDGRLVPYGLGWVILERGGARWVGHSGAQPGISTYLLASPSDGLAVAVLSNLEGLNLEPLSVSIAEILLRSGNCAITRDRSLPSRATSHPGTP